MRPDEVFLALIQLRTPHVFLVLVYGYAALWFTTPYYVVSMIASLVTIIVYRRVPAMRFRSLPPYPSPDKRSMPMHVLEGIAPPHDAGTGAATDVAHDPATGPLHRRHGVGAVGTGKTSACIYPYADQLLRWRSDDEQRKIGGLVLEVKGDFCGQVGQVRSILSRAGRADDYLEIGVDTGVCYNPLHNDLDPYAVAYAIATLLNNLFGRSKEPFWQQAYTDLLVGTQSISSLRSALPGDESTQMSIQSFPHAGGHRCREG